MRSNIVEQILFVLHDGKISQWNLSRGELAAVTVRGQHKVPYTHETAKAYWAECDTPEVLTYK